MARHSHSIYRRLATWLVAGAGGLLLATGIVLNAMVAERLSDELDQTLLAKARALVSLTEQDEDGLELDLAEGAMPEFYPGDEPEYFQLWHADGGEFARSASLVRSELPRRDGRSGEARFADLALPDGRDGRSVQLEFVPALDLDEDDDDDEQEGVDGAAGEGEVRREPAAPAPMAIEPPPLTLVVAREREGLDELLGTIASMLWIAGGVAMALIMLLLRVALSAGLRPLADVSEQVARLDADALGTRLAPRERTVELDGVVRQFNALLDRLQEAFERERQFTSDVAHELRTPLAELRSLSEVGGRWAEDPALARDFFDEVLAATRQIERIVVNLLALARCEKGIEIVRPEALELTAMVEAAWARVAPEAEAKGLAFQRQGPRRLDVETGRDQMALILNNLCANAVAYSPPGATVNCAIDAGEGRYVLRLANPATHLQASDLPHLFDRLWRKDPARANGRHAGLGLSLVRAYAGQLGLALGVALADDGTFSIELSGTLQSGAMPDSAPRAAHRRAGAAGIVASGGQEA